jgi:Domain of unknown function (DUF4124)/WXXGXW repeat (2 copies)
MRSDTLWHSAGRVAVILLVCPAWAAATDVYKSVDSEGHVVYSDRADVAAAQSVVHIDDAQTPPDLIHFCWTNCFTLSFANGLYRRIDGTEETWTVESFTPTSVILHRHGVPAEWNGFSADVIYQGQVSNGRLINISVNGHSVPDINMAWGAALGMLPGSNAERDQGPPPAGFEPAVDLDMRTAEAPPPLLIDVQPPCAQEGYLWTPGYWAWGGEYHWMAGAWVRPPQVGVLWTPGYWEFAGPFYVFHPGYWGPHIGFYGGINYGFGYGGVGFLGGRWVGNSFAYNRTVNNLDASVIHNTYSETVSNNAVRNRVSYNGGSGGITAAASAQERAAAAEPHLPPATSQRQVMQRAAASLPPAMVVTRIHTTSSAPPVARAHGAVAPPAPAPASAAATAAAAVTPTKTNRPSVAHTPRNMPAQAEGAEDAPAAAKTGAKPTKPPPHHQQ